MFDTEVGLGSVVFIVQHIHIDVNKLKIDMYILL